MLIKAWASSKKKPNIDIKQVTYNHNEGSTKATVTLEVYGIIEDRGSQEGFNFVAYTIMIYTGNNTYYINYLNKICQIESDLGELENLTDWSVDGGLLTINFNLISADEVYDSMVGTTMDLSFSDENIGYFIDMAPDELFISAGGPYSGDVDDNINFIPDVPLGIPPYEYEWDFGDGETSDEEKPSHAYSAAGEYIVTLTVTDSQGLTETTTTTVNIESSSSGGNGGSSNGGKTDTDNNTVIIFALVIGMIIVIGIVVLIYIIRR